MEKVSLSKWHEAAGISMDILRNQMPYLAYGFNGKVAVNKLSSGLTILVGSESGTTSGVNLIYRFDSSAQNAQLLYVNPDYSPIRISGIPPSPVLADQIKLNLYLKIEEGYKMLSVFTANELENIKKRFPQAQDCDQIVLGNQLAESRISLSFNLKDKEPPIRCMYNYFIDTDTVELVYTNDGKGNVWAKWNEKKVV